MNITEKTVSTLSLATQGVGIVFVAIFLVAYLGALPSTNVLHSELVFRIPLIIFGAVLLMLILASLVVAVYLRKNKIVVSARSQTISQQKINTAIKIALLTITIAYFLFNLRTIATLEWIGEWARTPGRINTIQLIEDINATIGNSFRMAGSAVALVALIYYFVKKGISKNRSLQIIRIVLVFEAIYWFGLLASGISGIYRIFAFPSFFSLNSFLSYTLPAILEATIVPISLIILAYKLGPNKPIKNSIKWGLTSATLLIFVYWLLNTGIWNLTLPVKGIEYLTNYPYIMIAFLSTAVGLLALTLYSAYVTNKLSNTENLENLNLRPIGIIILGLGLFYLWNYLTWIFFGGNHVWSEWYAWLLGHNMDLWMLSLPLIAIPLIFAGTIVEQNDFARENWSEKHSNKEYNQ